jgi:glycerate 2-kinase
MKQVAQDIFRQTLAAIDVAACIQKTLAPNGPRIHLLGTEYDLRHFEKIVAVSFGKASFAMAQGLTSALLPECPLEGILVVPQGAPCQLAGWAALTGGHPLPDVASFEAGAAILGRLARCDRRTLVVFLISGGGSSMVEQPLARDGVVSLTLDDFVQLHRALITCGAPIEEINAIRKHVSATKGGRLATAAPYSTKLTLAVSDVPAGHESALASGPTLPDPTTVGDAQRIARRYNLIARFPSPLREAFEQYELPETPKSDDPAFARSQFAVVLGGHELTHAAHHACERAGYACICDNSTDNWPLDKAADYLLSVLKAQWKTQRRINSLRPVAVVAQGELSSPVTDGGTGGRNSAFVLECVRKIAGEKVTVLSAGTDGIDGNSPAAGAVADGETLARSRAAGLDAGDFMRRSDAYHFFARLGDDVTTGPTGNNLRDLRILLAGHYD